MTGCWACHGPHRASERVACIEKQRAYYALPETRERRARHRSTEQAKERNRQLQRSPKRREWGRQYRQRPVVKAKIKAYRQRPEVRAKDRAYWLSPIGREKARRRNQRYNQKPEVRERLKQRVHQPDVKARHNEINRRWMREHYSPRLRVKAQRKAYSQRPDVRARESANQVKRRRDRGILPRGQTRPENTMERLLHSNFPGDWRYTGQGNITIARLAPDFYNVNGKKAIIEVYGCYHHNCPTCRLKPGPRTHEADAKRISLFEDVGLRTLVVWQHELENPEEVVQRVRERFYGGES